MINRWVLIAIAAVLLVPLVLAFAYPRWMLSPGPLPAYHDQVADDCFACHTPFRGVSSPACAACHAPAQIGVRTTKGAPIARTAARPAFHQALIEQNCLACHAGHAGPQLTPFDRKRFAHDLLRPATRENCRACHVAPQDAMHRGLAANCAQCHSPGAWKPATFDHAKFFLLDADHNVACTTCHVGADYRGYTCYGCHEHTLERIRAKHEEEGIRNFENCVRCHRTPNGEPGEGGERD